MENLLVDPDNIHIEALVEPFVKYGYFSALVSLCIKKI
jgi:hypothetical protein